MDKSQFHYPAPYNEQGSSSYRQGLIINCCGFQQIYKSFTVRCDRRDFSVYFINSGQMDVVLGEKVYKMEPGHIIVYYPKTPFCHYLVNGENVDVFWIHFTGCEAENLVESCMVKNRALTDTRMEKPSITKDFEAIFHELTNNNGRQTYMATAHLISIITKIGQTISSGSDDFYKNNGRIYRSLSHIHQNYNTPLLIETLAEIEHVTASHFRAVFKSCTGFSPKEYITNLRIRHACRLIAQEELSISQVAGAVGYRDPLYFSRLFKMRTGQMPTDYKKSHAGDSN